MSTNAKRSYVTEHFTPTPTECYGVLTNQLSFQVSKTTVVQIIYTILYMHVTVLLRRNRFLFK
jgi:hypothetical protein